MKQWLLLIAFLFTIGQSAEAQNSRKISIKCDDSKTLYNIELGKSCIEGSEDERKKLIDEQIKIVTSFNSAFIGAKLSHLFVCDNSNCDNPATMDCNKSAQVSRVKFKQRKISDNKYEVTFFGTVKVSCSTCNAGSGGSGICGDDTFFNPSSQLLECGTSTQVTIGTASLFVNVSAAQAGIISNAAAASMTNFYKNFSNELPISVTCYDIICDPGEICIGTKSLANVVAMAPVQVSNSPLCFRLDFDLNVNLECSTCEKDEKEEKEPEELSTGKIPGVINQVYPNPVRDYVMIELNEMKQDTPEISSRQLQIEDKTILVHIVDLQGKVMQTAALDNGERSIAISVNNFENGIHFILIESDGKIIERRKIIIQNN